MVAVIIPSGHDWKTNFFTLSLRQKASETAELICPSSLAVLVTCTLGHLWVRKENRKNCNPISINKWACIVSKIPDKVSVSDFWPVNVELLGATDWSRSPGANNETPLFFLKQILTTSSVIGISSASWTVTLIICPRPLKLISRARHSDHSLFSDFFPAYEIPGWPSSSRWRIRL